MFPQKYFSYKFPKLIPHFQLFILRPPYFFSAILLFRILFSIFFSTSGTQKGGREMLEFNLFTEAAINRHCEHWREASAERKLKKKDGVRECNE